MLLDNKADVNAQGGTYGNALQAALSRGHEQVVKMLLDNKADANAQAGYYGNGLQAASAAGHEQVVKILLDNKANVNAQGGYYGNALQAASARGHRQVAKVLLDNKADVNAQGGRYGSAMHAAAYGGHKEALELLISSGSISQLQDYYGRTLLWWAAAGGNIATVEALINQHNVDPQTADRFGRKPFWIATKKGHGAVSKLLNGYIDETDTERKASTKVNNDQPCLECDVCTSSIPTSARHYHCNFCTGGDWDVCEDCRKTEATCVEPSHTLVKRTMLDGGWVEVTG
ncbi:ankyrin [Macroventuria anomochaeta]|uniref:Ankyrin n=1 Tax=Macroventuria anomochaeta TaxID=301207 RepID=A0ACB6RRN0_9PLEO|nr:ankyrin [Macroventuria anomochaeta]KAF2623587.1 ankyrin [Macroventuria anomochaeta]